MKKIKYRFTWVEIVIIIIASAILASFSTSLIMYKSYSFNLNHKSVYIDQDLNNFISAYSTITEKYYQKVDREELINAAIEGMTSNLGERYTTYLSEAEAAALEEQLVGEYQGIGVQITDGNVVEKVFANSPAQKAGLKTKDAIVKVNDQDVTQMTSIELATLIKGMNNKKFDLTIKRDDKLLTFELKTETFNIPTVESQIFNVDDQQIGYLQIGTFSNTAAAQVKSSLTKIETTGINSLIIDLRFNSGGYLDAAEQIANIFLEKAQIIYYLKDKTGITAYKDSTKESRKYQIVVLQNESSASASEVLAGALKDSYGATIVGTKSFGKGKVQQTEKLKDGSMIKYTTAEWLRPNKKGIDGLGINPDYKINIEYDKEKGTIIDTQLEKAKAILAK